MLSGLFKIIYQCVFFEFFLKNFFCVKYVICLFYNDCGDLMMGDFNGMVYVWGDGGNKIINFIKYGYDV